jgi:AcrR family transcriptional regulator
MPRWPEDSRDRLVDAALALFLEHGYAAVTVDDIAARSGVSARTFFRHFPDKEEVLFADDDALLPALLTAIAASTGAASAEEHMTGALLTLADVLEPQREQLRHRQRVIDSQVSLTGRELAKQARWQQAVTAELTDAGYSPEEADLLAAIGFAVFRRALHSWATDTGPETLRDRVRAALPRVRTVLDATATAPRN